MAAAVELEPEAASRCRCRRAVGEIRVFDVRVAATFATAHAALSAAAPEAADRSSHLFAGCRISNIQGELTGTTVKNQAQIFRNQLILLNSNSKFYQIKHIG